MKSSMVVAIICFGAVACGEGDEYASTSAGNPPHVQNEEQVSLLTSVAEKKSYSAPSNSVLSGSPALSQLGKSVDQLPMRENSVASAAENHVSLSVSSDESASDLPLGSPLLNVVVVPSPANENVAVSSAGVSKTDANLLSPVAGRKSSLASSLTPPPSPKPHASFPLVSSNESSASTNSDGLFVTSPVAEKKFSLEGSLTPPLSPFPGISGDQFSASANSAGSPATPLTSFSSEPATTPVTPLPNQRERSVEKLEELAEKHLGLLKLAVENPYPLADFSRGLATSNAAPGLGIYIGQPLKIESFNGASPSSSNPASRHPSALVIPANGFTPASSAPTPTKRNSVGWPSELTEQLIGLLSDSSSPASDTASFFTRRSSRVWPSESPSSASASTKRNSGAWQLESPSSASAPARRSSVMWPSAQTKKFKALSPDSSSPAPDTAQPSAKGNFGASIASNSAGQQNTHNPSTTTVSRKLAASPISPTSDFKPFITQEGPMKTNLEELPGFSYYFNKGADALKIDEKNKDYDYIFFDYYFFSIYNPKVKLDKPVSLEEKVTLSVYVKNLYKWIFIDKVFSDFNINNFPRDEANAARLVMVMTNFDFESKFDGVRHIWQRKDYDSDFPILFRRFEDNEWYKYVLTGDQFSWKKVDVDHFEYWLGQGTRFVHFTSDEVELTRAEEERFHLGQIEEESPECGNVDE
ncbi:MAG: hypothetical protein ON057_000138 [Glomeribacter sp. 1016415]|nr:hypothetical protein [Glomeribacter sp. 1016415]